MAIRNEKKIIEGHEVQVTTFGGTRGLMYQIKLAKLLKNVIKDVLPSDIEIKISDLSSLTNLDLPLPKIIEGILGLFSTLSQQDTMELVKGLLEETLIDNKELSNKGLFDDVFAGEYKLLYQTLLFVLQVNYSFLSKSGTGEV